MSRIAALVVAVSVSVPVTYPVAHACGDKFLMAGRGAKFQRAYASVYPGKVLIYSQSSKNAKTAIRDPQLHKALRQAGHKLVDVDGVRVTFPDGWGLIRASNTQPILVMRFEAPNAQKLAEYRGIVEKVLDDVKREVGA